MEEGQFLALAASILQGSGDGQAVCIRALAEDRGLALRPADCAAADAKPSDLHMSRMKSR